MTFYALSFQRFCLRDYSAPDFSPARAKKKPSGNPDGSGVYFLFPILENVKTKIIAIRQNRNDTEVFRRKIAKYIEIAMFANARMITKMARNFFMFMASESEKLICISIATILRNCKK